ncbi:hypothetical protein PGH07_07930 [Sulfurovum sp. zt1-1]|uniref:Uncharacterized protein n=1 Tax=Sulfurovum zhangzhouensis TaxID=3019067 RepID=A0ABT7R0T5_9BACT|nr:hypothetical protein [Sulfurovum zhangzhouensis]MDM5272106.1 hypothetical protein [Sulfurovum zhangzhouensis]
MEIRVFASKKFANEDTILYKPSSVIDIPFDHRPEDTYPVIELDESESASLKNLYDDGWRIAKVTNHKYLHIFFMERG